MSGTNREFLAERDLKIAKMRQSGLSFDEIGKRFGISSKAAAAGYERILKRNSRDFMLAHPELIREQLDRYDYLLSQAWTMCSMRSITLPDGTKQILDPDPKFMTVALQIMSQREKLLNMQQTTVNVNVEEPVRAAMAGVEKPQELTAHAPDELGKQMIEIMLKSGIIPEEMFANAGVEAPKELESAQMKSLAEIEAELDVIDE